MQPKIKTLRVGVTGNIGSGKSTIVKMFAALGAPVYDADLRAKTLMNTNPIVKQQLIAKFGAKIYENNQLQNKLLGQMVFSSSENLKALNDIIHPIVIEDAQHWMNEQNYFYTIKEAALIFESGSNKDLDFVIGVSAPKELALQRVIKRDNCTYEQALAKYEKQMPEKEKMALCHAVIINDNESPILDDVLSLHYRFIKRLENF